MSWGQHDSGAFTSDTGDAYENYFRYDADHVWGDLDPDLLIDETQWLRPVHVRGARAAGGGHSWIVFGYDLFTPYNPYFWMNMGWDIEDNALYRFDNVPGGFEIGNEHTTYIAPDSVGRFVGPDGTSGADGSPANPYLNISEAVNETPDDGTIIIKAGTDANWSGGGVMDRPVTLKGNGVTISSQ